MEKERTLVREDGSKPSPSKSSGDIDPHMHYMLYFEGLTREEATGVLAGFGVAICDQHDNLLFQMKGSLHDSAITVLEAELTALKRGLTEAVRLGITHILIICDYQLPVFELVMGRSAPEKVSIGLIMGDVQRIRQQLRSSIAVLMTENNQTKFAYKLAMETLVSEISIRIPPAQKHTCRICFDDDFEDDHMFAAAICGHQFCMECMKRYIEVRLLEGTALGCPHHPCESKLDITSCVNLLTPKLREMWERRNEEESVPVADRVYCPNPRCSALMSEAGLSKSTDHDDQEEDGSKRCCVKCGKPFCINCKVAWHSNLSCDDYERLGPNPTENDIKLISLANQKKWRRCGKCQHMVERSYGCTQITCRCGYSFCYQCGDEWKPGGCHHLERSESHYCARFILLLLGLFYVLGMCYLSKIKRY